MFAIVGLTSYEVNSFKYWWFNYFITCKKKTPNCVISEFF